MMSVGSIVAMNEDAAAKAAKRKRVPYVPTAAAIEANVIPRGIPNFGYFEPEGWAPTETVWWVDKTGMDDSGPALSHTRFLEAWQEYARAHRAHGYAIPEEGPFQLYITAFRPEVAGYEDTEEEDPGGESLP